MLASALHENDECEDSANSVEMTAPGGIDPSGASTIAPGPRRVPAASVRDPLTMSVGVESSISPIFAPSEKTRVDDKVDIIISPSTKFSSSIPSRKKLRVHKPTIPASLIWLATFGLSPRCIITAEPV